MNANINRTHGHLGWAPRYDRALVLDGRDPSGVYGHYGYGPYWETGHNELV